MRSVVPGRRKIKFEKIHNFSSYEFENDILGPLVGVFSEMELANLNDGLFNNLFFNGHEIKVFIDENEECYRKRYWFMANDIARDVLSYNDPNTAVRSHCKYPISLRNQARRFTGLENIHPQTSMIPLSDVFRLAARSNLDAAEVFRDWLFDDVLTSIAIQGHYQLPQQQNALPAPLEYIRQHAESLTTEEDKTKLKKKLEEIGDSVLKNQRHSKMGHNGGTMTQRNIRNDKLKLAEKTAECEDNRV